MSGTSYLILGYALGLGLLGAYLVKMWIESHLLEKRERRAGSGDR